jgi:hypothetical protein
MPPVLPSAQLLDTLRRQIAHLEGTRQRGAPTMVSSGYAAVDQLLPHHGFARGTLAEWLSAIDASGAAGLALTTAREACRNGGTLVILDPRREFYPPAAARVGIELARLIVVHPYSVADQLWAFDQVLRCGGVAAAMIHLDRLDDHVFRRLQLAAEEGESLGLLLRPGSVQNAPSWADVRLLVEPLPIVDPAAGRCLRISLLRGRGGNQESVKVMVDDATHSMPLVSRWDESTVRRRAAGA